MLAVAGQSAVVKEYVRVDGTTDAAPPPGQVLQADMFANDALWKKPNIYGDHLMLGRRNGMLAVGGKVATNRLDTGWNLSTKALPLTVRGLGYALSFRVDARPVIRQSGGGETYSCAVVWYDHGGNRIERDPFPLRLSSEKNVRKLMIGSVPLAAESYSVQFGFDRPDLFAGDRVRLSELSFSVLERETDSAWMPKQDEETPRVRVVSETPFRDPKADLKIAVESLRPIDWSKVSFKINGKDETAGFVRDGNVFTYKVDGKWGRCLHTVDVTVPDPETGESLTAHKTILCGEPPKRAKVRLREDGVALVGGVPFFPIGVYSVCEREFNGNSLDKAFEDLKAAGVNTVHSYSDTRGEKFLSAADRHGLKVWSAVWKADKAFVEKTRHHPSVLAWYVGDDTSMHATPFEVYDRSDSVLSADPTRITVQADVMNSGDAVSSYRPFVKTTDVFMPEIYPCHSAERVPQPDCVAKAIRDMKRFKQDVAEAKDVRPKAIWPIIQYFDGWNAWKRFPTRDELFAMSFVTLVHGAQGITWYTYGGFPEPKKNRINRGVTATPEIWANFTNLTSRIAELVPALTMPAPMQPKPAKVLTGPACDALLNASISVSLRRAGCDAYLLAVNSACEPVTAELDLFDRVAGDVEVLWENRRAKVSGGTVREDFAPFAVHVYHWRTPDVEYVGHQGEEALAPNHSRPAYDFAVKNGLDRIKLDIRETKDGEVVLQHDDTLKAVMGWDVRIRDLTLAEIREKGRCHPRGGYTNETIVTLAEALEYGKRTKKGVWIDFKDFSPKLADKVFGICEKSGLGRDRIMVATWSKPALKYVQERYPDVQRVAHTFIRIAPDGNGYTTNSGEKDKVYASEDELIAELLRHRDELGLTGFNMPHIVRRGKPLYHTTEKVVRALKAAGCWVSIWFVDDPFTGELFRGFGVDNFVTAWAARTKREFRSDPEFWSSVDWPQLDLGLGWPVFSRAADSAKTSATVWPKLPDGLLDAHFSPDLEESRVYWDWPVKLKLSSERGLSFDFLVEDMSDVFDVFLYLHSGKGWYHVSLPLTKEGAWERVTVKKSDFSWDSKGKSGDWDAIDKIRLSVWRSGLKGTKVGFRNFAYATEAECAVPRFPETPPLDLKKGEWRAFWCHSARGLKGKTWDESIRILKAAGFNAIVPNLARGGSVFYRSDVLPEDPSVATQGDALRECLAACRKYGVECHVWKMCWNPWTADKKTIAAWQAAGRTQKSDTGEDKGFDDWLCPTHPDNLKLEADAFVELAKSGADGVHLDYIRYPYRAPYCYCDRCRALFEKRVGRRFEKWPADVKKDKAMRTAWTAFRSENITALVREVSRRVREEAPGVKVSAAVFECPLTVAQDNGQDWLTWCREKLVDFVCPMNYYLNSCSLHTALCRQQGRMAVGVPVRPGIGPSVWEGEMSARDDAEKAKAQIRGIRANGQDGFCVFDFADRTVNMLPFVFGADVGNK